MKAYNTLNSQGVERHLDNVKREIEKERVKVENPLKLDLEGSNTEQVIYQAEKYYRTVSSSLDRMEILNNLLKELETKALPESLAGERQRTIIDLEVNVYGLEKKIESLQRMQAHDDRIRSMRQRLQDARTELEEMGAARMNKEQAGVVR